MVVTKEAVAIFWDFGFEIADAIGYVAHEWGAVTSFRAYSDIPETTMFDSEIRSELQIAGVSICVCPQDGSKASMILTDMLAYAMDHPHPATIVLVSDNQQLAYPMSILRLRRYRTVVIAPYTAHSSLKLRATAFVDWDGLMEDENSQAESKTRGVLDDNSIQAISNSPSRNSNRRFEGGADADDDDDDASDHDSDSGIALDGRSLIGSDGEYAAQAAGLVAAESPVDLISGPLTDARREPVPTIRTAQLASIVLDNHLHSAATDSPAETLGSAPSDEVPAHPTEAETLPFLPGTLEPLTKVHVVGYPDSFTEAFEGLGDIPTPSLPEDFLLAGSEEAPSEFSLTSQFDSDAEDDATTEETSMSGAEESALDTSPDADANIASPTTPRGPLLSGGRPSLWPEVFSLNPTTLAAPTSAIDESSTPTARDTAIPTPYSRSRSSSRRSSISNNSVRVVGGFPIKKVASPSGDIPDLEQSPWRTLVASVRGDSTPTKADIQVEKQTAKEESSRPLWSKYRDTFVSMMTFRRQISESPDVAAVIPPEVPPIAATQQASTEPEAESSLPAVEEVASPSPLDEQTALAPSSPSAEPVDASPSSLPELLATTVDNDDGLPALDKGGASDIDSDVASESQSVSIPEAIPDGQPQESEDLISVPDMEVEVPRDPSPETESRLSPVQEPSERALGKRKADEDSWPTDSVEEPSATLEDFQSCTVPAERPLVDAPESKKSISASPSILDVDTANIEQDDSSPSTDNHSPTLLPSTTSPSVSTLVPLAIDPALFQSLVEELQHHDSPCVDRSLVAIGLLALDPDAYARVGVASFKEYTARAVEAGIVSIGFTKHTNGSKLPWMSLMPAWKESLNRTTAAISQNDWEALAPTTAVAPPETPTSNLSSEPQPAPTPLPAIQPSSPVPSQTINPHSRNTVEEHFRSLVEELQQHKGSQAERSLLATALVKRDPGVYDRAGLQGKAKTRFTRLATLAQMKGIVTMGDAPTPWVSLAPAWRLSNSTTPSAASTRPSSPLPKPFGKATAASTTSSARTAPTSSPIPFPTTSSTSDAQPAPKFALLIARLEKMRSNGVSQPWRMLVNMDLLAQNPRVYAEAGVSGFDQYAKEAMQAGVVTLGGEGGRAWVTLV